MNPIRSKYLKDLKEGLYHLDFEHSLLLVSKAQVKLLHIFSKYEVLDSDTSSLSSSPSISLVPLPSNPSMASVYKSFTNDLEGGRFPVYSLKALSLCCKCD